VIPKILHQTWKSQTIAAPFRRYVESWKLFHPKWEIKLWTDVDLGEFVAARHPEYSDQFRSYPQQIMRADLGRYLILKEFGGVYADLDAEAVATFDELLESDVPLFAYEPQSHAASEFVHKRGFRSIVSNAIILSPPAHPFWDDFLRLLRRCRYAGNPLDSTGPFVLTAAVETAQGAAAPRLLPAHVFFPLDKSDMPVDRTGSSLRTFAIHHWAGTWWKPQEAGAEAATNAEPATPGATATQDVIAHDFAVAEKQACEFLSSIDRAAINSTARKNGHVLVAVPVRDAADTIDELFRCIRALRYPRDKLSLALLEGDSVDGTFERLKELARLHNTGFRRIEVIKRDFGTITPVPRWAPALQRSRRSNIARLRNELVKQALQDEDWVLWIDADIIAFPEDILSTLISIGARIVHPNAVRVPGADSMDLNAWVSERPIPPAIMAASISDGLYQPPKSFQRLYLSDLRYRDIVPLNSVGGTMLLVDADLHRAGLLFPEQPYRFLIETEAFGAAACDLGIVPVGLPNVEILHSLR
jgi:hypothetical protein